MFFFEIKDQLQNTLLEDLNLDSGLLNYTIENIEISNNPPYYFGIYGSILIQVDELFLEKLYKNSTLRKNIVSTIQETTAWAEEVINTHVLSESFMDANISSIYVKLKVDESSFKQIQNRLNKTRRNIQARQKYRTITGLRTLGPEFSARQNLPENVARQIAEFSEGPLNNTFQRVRPLPEALKTQTLKLPYETRLAKAEHARKPNLSKVSTNTRNTYTAKNSAKNSATNKNAAKKPWWRFW